MFYFSLIGFKCGEYGERHIKCNIKMWYYKKKKKNTFLKTIIIKNQL